MVFTLTHLISFLVSFALALVFAFDRCRVNKDRHLRITLPIESLQWKLEIGNLNTNLSSVLLLAGFQLESPLCRRA